MRHHEKVSKIMNKIINLITSTNNSQSINNTDRLYKMLDDILYAMNDSTNITITDCDGTILYVNDKFCKMSKYSRCEIIGKNHRIVNSGYHPKEFFKQMWNTIKSGNTWRGEIKNKAKDGSIYWIYEIIVPFINENGEPYQFISFQTDITESKQKVTQFKTNFMTTFQNLKNGIFKVRKEQDGKMIYVMSEGKLMDEIGANAQKILLKSPSEVFESDIAEIKQKMYSKAFEGNKVHYEIELNGKLIYVDLEPISHNGVITEIVGTVYDISALRYVEKQLKIKEERYQSLINFTYEYIIMLDKEGTIVYMNPKTMEVLGVEETSFGQMHILEAIAEEDRAFFNERLEKALNGKVQIFEFVVKNLGQRRFFNITIVPIIVDNEIDGVNVIGKDITEEKLIQERNEYLAHHDELTGLHNRRWMEQEIEKTIIHTEANNHLKAILLLDLDRFKSINDTLGHFVGDELLQQIATRLLNNMYKNQIHVARMGGDEFMILCPKLENRNKVNEIAQNILDSLRDPFYVQGYELLITASIGIVLYSSSDTNVTNLMKSVDIALYNSKELGRNMYQIYDSSMNHEDYQSFVLERDLRKAIMNEEFIAHFQPRVDALTGKIVGAEALIRWNHPKQGLISPGRFIPLAEETGLIFQMGKWMLRKVCEKLVEWRNAGYSLIPISVNISSKRFLYQGFAEEIRKLLEQFKLEGEWLEIEITENSIIRNEEIVQKTLKDLKAMGVKIFIDDFGTGYSSFNYLKTFNLDGVKIDQSFIRDISKKPENASITSAMIQVAKQLKLEVIAEGVETKEELDYLLGENCRYIQGFYFGRPCPIEEFENTYLQAMK